MLTIEERTAVTANNLANVDTAGFKSDLLTCAAAPNLSTYRLGDPQHHDELGHPIPVPIGSTNLGVTDVTIWRNFSAGPVVPSDNSHDLAVLDDPGTGAVNMLRVVEQSGPNAGKTYYTRDGQLKVSADGFLVDNQGRRVQGDGGDIAVGDADGLKYDVTGNVLVNNQSVDRLNLARFDDPQQQLEKLGGNLWRLKTETGAADPAGNGLDNGAGISPGCVEHSNADAVGSIVELITNMRHYEASQKMIQSEDSTLNIAVNQLGRLSQQ